MSAIILAGGFAKRFGQDKGLVMLAKKPLVLHVLDKLTSVVNEVVVVVNSHSQKNKFAEVIEQKARIEVDRVKLRTPLVGALTGFQAVQSDHSVLLACDLPFLSSTTVSFLLSACISKNAVIPRWPNGNIEPLHAVYHAKRAAEAARTALHKGNRDMRSMIAYMPSIQYISTTIFRKFDSKLTTFFNVNTPSDLKNAAAILEQ